MLFIFKFREKHKRFWKIANNRNRVNSDRRDVGVRVTSDSPDIAPRDPKANKPVN